MRTSLLVAAALACGCQKNEDAPPAPAAKLAPGVAPKSVGLEVFVNDASVAKLAPDQLAKWPRLDALVPPDDRRLGTWQVVTIVADKTTDVPKPSANYPEMIPAVFPGEGGAPAFGMFDPVELAKRGKPGLRQDGVREIRIKLMTEGRGGDHQGGTGDGSDPSKLVIDIKSPEGEYKLTGEQLLALPRIPQPGNEDTKGWNLKQLLDAAGVKKLDKVTALDTSGTSVVLEKKEMLDDKKLVPFIKLNRQGSLRLRVMKKVGDGWQAGGDLRSLATIIVGK